MSSSTTTTPPTRVTVTVMASLQTPSCDNVISDTRKRETAAVRSNYTPMNVFRAAQIYKCFPSLYIFYQRKSHSISPQFFLEQNLLNLVDKFCNHQSLLTTY